MRTLALSLALLTACNPLPSEVTYYEHVQPVVQEHCVRCHQADGLGVGDFTDPTTVVAMASRIEARTTAGTMPLPVADPECRDYVGSEHMTLESRDLKLISKWVEQGASLGDAAAAVNFVSETPKLEDADLVLTIPPYTPTFADAANPGNEYRCFALDPERDEDFFATALHPMIDAESIVHHIVIGVVPRDGVAREAFEPGGVDCIYDDMGAVENMMAAWAPGSKPQVFEEGAGIRVGTDEVLMMQMHYYDSKPDQGIPVDESGYALKTVSAVETELEVLTLGSVNFRIPANDPAYTHEDIMRAPRDLRIHGVFPHMHVLGSAYELTVDEQKDGCLVAGDIYDFDNQLTYLFTEPMDVKAEETLRWSCTWNNSTSNPDLIADPPQETFYGERTDEEMCFFFTLVEVE